jgi:hypothetical protein
MDLDKATDLELAKIYGQVYQQLIQAQHNLQMISAEIARREPKVKK